MFITFEGIDLSGKSTQIKLLNDYLENHDKTVIMVREPGGTVVSESIRNILLDKKFTGMFPMTEFLLFSASRFQLTEEIIKPHLAKGDFVLCDRYYDSSTAYQGFGGQISIDIINQINSLASNGLTPDISFLIDIDIDEVLKRRSISGKSKDRMEEKEEEYFRKVANGYRKLAEDNKERFYVIDGTQTILDIHKQIIKTINDKITK